MINGSEGACKIHLKGTLAEDLQNSNILAEPKLMSLNYAKKGK